MKILSVFNNKGGVGKTTLTYHLGHILAEMGKRVLFIDLDPQCNLTTYSVSIPKIDEIWKVEEPFLENFAQAKENCEDFEAFCSAPRSIHFLLAPVEQGESDIDIVSPVLPLYEDTDGRLDLIPGKLSVSSYEAAISERWGKVLMGDPFAVRTMLKIRKLAQKYATENRYDFVLIDTSPSLGNLNKIILSTADGFIVPCAPDLFSLYGLTNIGRSLRKWEKEFFLFRHMLTGEGKKFDKDIDFTFVKFLGYTIFNAKKYTGATEWNLARGHYNYARQIPEVIKKEIPSEVRVEDIREANNPIGGSAIMHTHNTYPSFAQTFHTPIWRLPEVNIEEYFSENEGWIDDEGKEEAQKNRNYFPSQRNNFEEIRQGYRCFAEDLLERVTHI